MLRNLLKMLVRDEKYDLTVHGGRKGWEKYKTVSHLYSSKFRLNNKTVT